MQFFLDIGRDDEGRVCGHVACDGQLPVSFSGWLDLLRLLEDLADGTTETTPKAPAPPVG